MRGCKRADEEGDEDERQSVVDYILFIDKYKCTNTNERNACALVRLKFL